MSGNKRYSRRRMIQLSGAATLTGLAGCLGGGNDEAGEGEFTDLTISMWGGPLTEGNREVFIEPFEDEHGIEINIQEHSNAFDVLSQVRQGQEVHGGIFDDFSLLDAYNDGMLVPIDTDIVTGLDDFFLDFVLDRPGAPGDEPHSVMSGLFPGGAFYDEDVVSEMSSWEDILLNEDLEGSFALLSNVPFYLPYTIAYSLDIDLNEALDGATQSEADDIMDQVWERLEDITERATDFGNDGNVISLASDGTIDAGQLAAGDAFNVAEDSDRSLVPFIPEEGIFANTSPWAIFDDTTNAGQAYTMQELIAFTLDRERRAEYATDHLSYIQGVDWGEFGNPMEGNPEQEHIDRINIVDPTVVNEFGEEWELTQRDIIQ